KKHYTVLFVLLIYTVSFQKESYAGVQGVSIPVNTDSIEYPLFSSHDILELSLTFDWKELVFDVGDIRSFHNAQLTYFITEGDSVSIPVEIQTRGHYRRSRDNCDFPPIRIWFPEDTVTNTLFSGQDKLKLVTHCNDNRKIFSEYLLKEYLAYRIYNLICDKSYKVRLARITYNDSERKNKQLTRVAFFIEKTEHLASRIGGIELEFSRLPKEVTDTELTLLFSVFQYLIGNTDWSIPGLHNVKLFSLPGPKYVPVPYDFDFSGLIGTYYAIPDPKIPIKSVLQRIYRGPCVELETILPVLEFFNRKKPEIYSLISDFEHLEQKERAKILRYFDKFYETLNNDRKLKREFIIKCSETRYISK
ncbi:MAG: hypothetical protein KAT38_01880, partial [Bacteroidales bacterium]|nr:hypothetical protein [Bacteroidales bacterium]